MKTINLTAENLQILKSLMQQFKNIDGNEEKSLELEDFLTLLPLEEI